MGLHLMRCNRKDTPHLGVFSKRVARPRGAHRDYSAFRTHRRKRRTESNQAGRGKQRGGCRALHRTCDRRWEKKRAKKMKEQKGGNDAGRKRT